jgi:hypothetical protein
MGVYRRDEQIKELNTTAGRFVVRTELEDADGELCWFCGRPVETSGESPTGGAALAIEPFGAGEPYHAVCHVACAERARGSLA